MGSMIYLSVGRLELEWGKNLGFHDHSFLYQESDIAQVPYRYSEWHSGRQFTEFKEGLSKPLTHVVERLNLLGYTARYAEYETEMNLALCDVDSQRFSCRDISSALATVDVSAIALYDNSDGEPGDLFRDHLFEALGLQHQVGDPDYVRRQAAMAMENLSSYSVLQMLSQNSAAASLPVTWQYADIEESGWARREHFIKPLRQADRFLIVTEGSSDAKIIKHALGILKPHLFDFFDFVDMDEGYPFSGTGNLFNFTKGLIGISVQNNVLIIYDNDAEGSYNFNRSLRLKTPSNMKILKLPDLEAFKEFMTVGPNGKHLADINGRAAAIECYLDVGPTASVMWTSFNRELEVYQGELINKREAMRRFLELRSDVGGYDFSRLSAVINLLITNCIEMREEARLRELESEF